MKKVGIYIHFPFCVSKCAYCNFNSYANKNDFQLKYFQSLLKEIAMYSTKDVEIDTIFIGGGTPSIMFDGSIATLLSEIKKNYNVLPDAEISIEANPNSITSTKVREWIDCGVNRVSIGLQTTNSSCLKLIGRPHTKQDFINAFNLCKNVGFGNINVDCLIGLPKQKLKDVKHTLNLVNKLGATHISVYSLILEDNTPLYNMVSSGEVTLPKEEKTLSMYNFALGYLLEVGFERYEVSNFAKPSFECKHNLHTWQMREYLGFGAGAHSYYNDYRYSNVLGIEDYIGKVFSGKLPIEEKEEIDNQERLEETIMLGLRTKEGINLKDIFNEFKYNLLEKKEKEIKMLESNGFIEISNDSLYATDLGFTVLNKIILELV